MLRKISLNLEILLYPFRNVHYNDEDAFYKQVTSDKKRGKNKISFLVRNVYEEIEPYTEVHSLDEVSLVLEKQYPILFDNDIHQEEELYSKYDCILSKLSKSIIAHRDGKIVFKYWENEEDKSLFGPYNAIQKIHIYETLNRLIPSDLLVCKYLVENDMHDIVNLHGYYSHIMLADKQLEGVLQKGVGENHLHFNASWEFTLLWTKYMNISFTHDYKELNHLRNWIGNEKIYYVLFSYVIRGALALFLVQRQENQNFFDWLFDMDVKVAQDISSIIEEKKSVQEWIREEKMQDEIHLNFFQNIWDKLWRISGKVKGDEFDYIFTLFPRANAIHTYGENVFLFYALEYQKMKQSDSFFYRTFLYYIRTKNEFFRKNVQNGKLKGLDYFKEFYASTGLFTKDETQLKFQVLFHNKYLKKIEIRIKPDYNTSQIRKNLKSILEAYATVIKKEMDLESGEYVDDFPKLGIVYHFLKRKDTYYHNKCWRKYLDNTEKEKAYLWYGELQSTYRAQMKEILELRNTIPYASNIITGLDAASGENDTPVFVFAPIFQEARDSKSQAINSYTLDGRIINNKSLCFTFHAGEDFRHMLSGLRRVDEVIEHCKFHAGDRIGHGIVLGIKPERWVKDNSMITIPRGEYLEDLVWVWGNLTASTSYDMGILVYLEKKIYDLAEQVYSVMNGITVPVLYKAYQKRFQKFDQEYLRKYITEDVQQDEGKTEDMDWNRKVFCKQTSRVEAQSWDADKIANAIHCSCYLLQYKEPIQVGITEYDLKIIKLMQQMMLYKISQKGIVIEMNPNSNISIGEMNSVLEHQAYVLNPIQNEVDHSIVVNINSDDPSVFNTNVCNEIAYLYYGLLEQNVGKEASIQWVDKIRQYGMDTSFVEDMDCEKYYKQLMSILEVLK